MGYRHEEAKRYRWQAAWARMRAQLRGPARFVATVVLSALLSVVIQEALPGAKSAVRTSARAAKQWLVNAWHYGSGSLDAAPREAAFVPTRSVPAIEQYERYYSEAMPLLRSDTSVQLVALEVPATALDAQSNGRTRTRDAPYALRARTRSFPALAVSKNARVFLETMRVTFVDPKRLPASVLEGIDSPLGTERLVEHFLLVPDVAGDKAGRFSFQRTR